MKIPKKLKIGGMVWEIEFNDKISNESNVFGSTHWRKQRIFLDPNETEQKKEQTFLHEVMHAIWWQAGLTERYKDQKNLEEEIINPVSQSLYQVLKDNKLLK